MPRNISRTSTVLALSLVFCLSMPLMVHAAGQQAFARHRAAIHSILSLHTHKVPPPAAKHHIYRNDQFLDRVLVKVMRYHKGDCYVTLMPQAPRSGPDLLALPNLTLEKLLALAKTRQELVVSGRISIYDGKYYLMLSPNIYQPGQFGLHVGGQMGKISRRRASRESAASILKKLLSHSISTPASEHIIIKPATRVELPLQDMNRPNSATAPALAEGTYIWNRMGHLQFDPVLRQWVFVFLSDGRRSPDAPIIILPSPQLAEMQALELQAHSRAILRISGIVTEFKDRNFLMPTYVQLYHNLGRF